MYEAEGIVHRYIYIYGIVSYILSMGIVWVRVRLSFFLSLSITLGLGLGHISVSAVFWHI